MSGTRRSAARPSRRRNGRVPGDARRRGRQLATSSAYRGSRAPSRRRTSTSAAASTRDHGVAYAGPRRPSRRSTPTCPASGTVSPRRHRPRSWARHAGHRRGTSSEPSGAGARHAYANVHSSKCPGGEIRGRSRTRTSGTTRSWRRHGVRPQAGPTAGLEPADDGQPNSAARAPSTTRWSKVTASVPSGVRRSPRRGRRPRATRPTLRIATSGWLTIGVWKRPASFPALVTVKVEPRTSSASSVPRARLREPRTSASISSERARRRRGRPARRALLGLDRDADVVAVEVDDRRRPRGGR